MVRLLALSVAFTWVSAAGAVEWVSKIDITPQEDQQLAESLPARGYVPIFSKETVTPDNQSRFDVVYLKPLDVTWEYRKLRDLDFQRRNRELQRMGYDLVSHQSYRVNGVLWHNSIWHKNR